MKKLILILTLVSMLPTSGIQSQSWAPEGAEWYYDYENFWYTGYVHIAVLGDTVIHDTTCRVLIRRNTIHDQLLDTTTSHYLGRSYMYSEDDKVYLFENNKFYILYDFSAVPGDTFTIPQNSSLSGSGFGCDPDGKIVVTDTGNIVINDHSYRRITVEPMEESHWAIYGHIVPTLGPLHSYMLPEPHWCVMDLAEGGPLRCYSDPEFGLHTTGIAPECDYLVSVPEIIDDGITIYPNPASGILHINIPGKVSIELTLYTSNGMKVLGRLLRQSENSIDVSDLKPGLYFARIKSYDGDINRLIVIQ